MFDTLGCMLIDSSGTSVFDLFECTLTDSLQLSQFDVFECSLVHVLVCLSACYCMFSAANHIKLLTLSQ